MDQRLKLNAILCEILGSNNVYFQPPETIKMKYPAIVYSRGDIKSDYANNHNYIQSRQYEIIVIDRNPDSDIIDKLLTLPKCKYDRHYVSNNLNHDVFTLYY